METGLRGCEAGGAYKNSQSRVNRQFELAFRKTYKDAATVGGSDRASTSILEATNGGELVISLALSTILCELGLSFETHHSPEFLTFLEESSGK
jgi:hypothetical protein